MRVLISKELTTVSGGGWQDLDDEGLAKDWLTLDASDTSGSISDTISDAVYEICVRGYTAVGTWYGAQIGGGLGSAVPVVGTVLGAAVGGVVGYGSGKAIGQNICPRPQWTGVPQGGSQRNSR